MSRVPPLYSKARFRRVFKWIGLNPHVPGTEEVPDRWIRSCDCCRFVLTTFTAGTNPMSLENLADLSQIVATLGVILSLVFVGFQVRQNTAALQRSEHNSAMSKWTVIRTTIAQKRELGELMTTGLRGGGTLDVADQLRLELLLAEFTWAFFHVWECTRSGVFPTGTFELAGESLLCDVLNTPQGSAWWRRDKRVGFTPEFVTAVDALLASDTPDLPAHGDGETEAPQA